MNASASSTDGRCPDDSNYILCLWNLIIRPPRKHYDEKELGPTLFKVPTSTGSMLVTRRDLNIINERGQKLRASFWEADKPEERPTVVYLHGNASCRLEAISMVPLVLARGMNLVAFDFSGCGMSEGRYVSLGLHERGDVRAVLSHIKTQYEVKNRGKLAPIALWGRSMGAATALMYAADEPCPNLCSIVADSPFCSLRELATDLANSRHCALSVPTFLIDGLMSLVRWRIAALEDGYAFDIDNCAPLEACKKAPLQVATLFLAGQRDDFVPKSHAQRCYKEYGSEQAARMRQGYRAPMGPANSSTTDPSSLGSIPTWKDLVICDGDHNTARDSTTVQRGITWIESAAEELQNTRDALRRFSGSQSLSKMAQFRGDCPADSPDPAARTQAVLSVASPLKVRDASEGPRMPVRDL